MTAPVEADGAVAVDIDGTVLHEDGSISDAVIEQVRRLDAAGHQVMLATGRSSAVTRRMGHAPAEVIAVANELTGTVHQDGLAQVLATLH